MGAVLRDQSRFCCGDRLLSICRQDYYSSGYYQEAEAAQGAPQEMSTDSSFLDDEAVGILLSIPLEEFVFKLC